MEYIHKWSDEHIVSILEMCASEDFQIQEMGFDMLNLSDISDKDTFKRIIKLIESYNEYIHFEYYTINGKAQFKFFPKHKYFEHLKLNQ